MKNFNPRAPRGARLNNAKYYASNVVFQSTRPARGATSIIGNCDTLLFHFNPRAPRGARQQK